MNRVSTEVTFWHSEEYGSDFRRNSGEIPRNSAEFRGISPELSRNHFRSQKIPRNSVSAEFRGHPMYESMNEWTTSISYFGKSSKFHLCCSSKVWTQNSGLQVFELRKIRTPDSKKINAVF